MAKKKRTSRGRGPGQGTNANGKPRSRRRRRGSGGGGAGPGGGGGGYENENGEVANDAPLEEGEGILELHPNGYGFLRSPENNYSRERSDPFVPGTMIERFGLREGVHLKAMVQQARRQQGPRVREILDVDGIEPEKYPEIKSFDQLTPINPEQWLNLECGRKPLTNRVIDLLAPLGKGQRALIVAPPRSGKTIMLQDIASGISQNHPELTLIVLLIDERPE
jgi:transcription termination factor Rho